MSLPVVRMLILQRTVSAFSDYFFIASSSLGVLFVFSVSIPSACDRRVETRHWASRVGRLFAPLVDQRVARGGGGRGRKR